MIAAPGESGAAEDSADTALKLVKRPGLIPLETETGSWNYPGIAATIPDMAKPDPRLPGRRRPVAATLTALTMMLAAVNVASLFESAHWILELFAHFRLQYLGVAACLLLLTLLTGPRRTVVINLALVAVNGWFVGNYWLTVSVEPASGAEGGLTVIHANLQSRSQRVDLLLQRARDEDADVLLIQELNAAGAQTLNAAEDYPFRYLYPDEGNFGIGIASRVKLNVQPERDPSDTLTFLSAKVPWGEAPLNLFYLHPPPPMSGAMTDTRNNLMNAIALRVRQTPNALVVGDINNTPWTQSFARFAADSSLAPLRAMPALAGTWPALPAPYDRWPIMLQIDHVFVQRATDVVAFRSLPSIESDHLPLLFRLAAQ